MQDRPGFDELYDPDTVAALDGWAPGAPAAPDRPLPSRVVRWSRSSLMGVVVTGFALGIQEVMEPKDEEVIVIEVDADGDPHDLPVRLFLDPDDPRGSLCFVRRDSPPAVI